MEIVLLVLDESFQYEILLDFFILDIKTAS